MNRSDQNKIIQVLEYFDLLHNHGFRGNTTFEDSNSRRVRRIEKHYQWLHEITKEIDDLDKVVHQRINVYEMQINKIRVTDGEWTHIEMPIVKKIFNESE